MPQSGYAYAETRNMNAIHIVFRREFGLLPDLVQSARAQVRDVYRSVLPLSGHFGRQTTVSLALARHAPSPVALCDRTDRGGNCEAADSLGPRTGTVSHQNRRWGARGSNPEPTD
jgi:hypothetical protein